MTVQLKIKCDMTRQRVRFAPVSPFVLFSRVSESKSFGKRIDLSVANKAMSYSGNDDTAGAPRHSQRGAQNNRQHMFLEVCSLWTIICVTRSQPCGWRCGNMTRAAFELGPPPHEAARRLAFEGRQWSDDDPSPPAPCCVTHGADLSTSLTSKS